MILVYCIGSLSKPGGTEQVLAAKANYLADVKGFEIHILIVDQKEKPICYQFSPKVIVHDMQISNYTKSLKIPGITYLLVLRKMKYLYTEKIKSIKPNIIIVAERGFHDFFIPSIVPEIPKIREFHFSKGAVNSRARIMNSFIKRMRYLILYQLLYRQFKKYHKLVLLTEKDKKEGKYGDNVVVIQNMINSFPSTFSNCQNKKVISVGSMYDDRKGFHKQIEIWNNIIHQNPDWTLHIYGDGPRIGFLKDLVKKYDLNSSIFLHGRSNIIQEKLEDCSIFIMTSEAEGLPMVLIEAMASGIPCIAYDCPTGPSDIISNNQDGYLIKMNDQKEFENKLNFLMNNDEVRIEMGKQSRINSTRYLPENIMSSWINLFESLI